MAGRDNGAALRASPIGQGAFGGGRRTHAPNSASAQKSSARTTYAARAPQEVLYSVVKAILFGERVDQRAATSLVCAPQEEAPEEKRRQPRSAEHTMKAAALVALCLQRAVALPRLADEKTLCERGRCDAHGLKYERVMPSQPGYQRGG